MKILFSTFGSLGDLHPYIAIAIEAKKRGHEPVFATSPKYRAKIEKLGFEFREIRPDLPSEEEFGPMAKRVMNLKDGPRYLFQEVIMPALRDSYSDLLTAMDDIDLLITHPAVPAGPLVGQKTGKKWMSSTLAPISMWSKYDPPVPPTMPQFDWMRCFGPLWATFLFAAGRAGTKPWIAAIEEVRREIGVASLGHPMFEGQYSPFGTLALFSPHYAKPQVDWPNNSTATGFCFYDSSGYEKQSASPEPTWKTWVKGGEPPIVFTLGSAAVFNAEEFWNATSCWVDGAHRSVMLTAGQYRFPDYDPDFGVLEVDYAPFSELFPAAKLVVHQGGIGTTAQVLRAGVPQMVVPHAHDQPDNAARVKRLRVGYGTEMKDYLRSVSMCLEDILSYYPRYQTNAAELGEKIREEDGPLNACIAMEQLFGA